MGCTAVATTTVTGDTSVPLASATNNGPLSCSTSSVGIDGEPCDGRDVLMEQRRSDYTDEDGDDSRDIYSYGNK